MTTAPDPNSVYEARVEIRGPDGTWIEKSANGGINPMFPTSWDADRVQAEVDSAWSERSIVPGRAEMWEGVSVSGVTIRGYLAPSMTAYPVREAS